MGNWRPVNTKWNLLETKFNTIFWAWETDVTPGLELGVTMYNQDFIAERHFIFEIYSVLYKNKCIDEWIYRCVDKEINIHLVIKSKG